MQKTVLKKATKTAFSLFLLVGFGISCQQPVTQDSGAEESIAEYAANVPEFVNLPANAIKKIHLGGSK